MRQRWRARLEATANGSASSIVHRREGYLDSLEIKPDTFSLFRRTFAGFSSSAVSCVTALPASGNFNEHEGQKKYVATASAHNQLALHGAHSSRSYSS
jgi:hypothetical protein